MFVGRLVFSSSNKARLFVGSFGTLVEIFIFDFKDIRLTSHRFVSVKVYLVLGWNKFVRKIHL